MFISKIKIFLKENKKIFYYIGLFFVFYYSFIETTFASEQLDERKDTAIEAINGITAMCSVLVGAMTYFVTLFLNNGWINGTIFGLHEIFRDIWILVSNVVYFVFAGLIIWIAFMNIIGKGEKWELKQSLPKFIIGVLIVPFSWFFVQFVLSLSAILTVGALTLPYDTFDSQKTIYEDISIQTDCVINLSYDGNNESTNDSSNDNTSNKEGFFYCKGETKTLKEVFNKSTFGIISIYTYGILNLDDLDELISKEFTTAKIKTLGDLLIKIVFNLLFVLIYMLLIITLGIVLAVRGIYLWVFIMISPVFGLMYFFDKDGGGEGVLSKFNIKQFISLALIPVYVTLALSFGLLFITTIGEGIHKSNTDKTNTGDIIAEKDTITIMDIITLEIKGPIGVASDDSSGGGSSDNLNPLQIIGTAGTSTLGTIGTLIVYVMGIAVLRVAIMAAIRSNDITKAVTEPIYNFGNEVGKLIAKSPQYAPIAPGGISMRGIEKVGSMPINALEQKSSNKVGGFQKGINKIFGADSVDVAAQARINNQLRNGIDDPKELKLIQDELKQLIEKHGTDNAIVRDLMKNFASKAEEKFTTFDKNDIEDLFKNGKLSKKGYGLLHVKEFTDDVNGFNSSTTEAYASSHQQAGGGDSKVEAKGEGDIQEVNKKEKLKLQNGKKINGEIKLAIDTSGELIVGNPDGKAGKMKFENYDELKVAKTPKEFFDKLKGSDQEQFLKLIKGLDLTREEKKTAFLKTFENLNGNSIYAEINTDLQGRLNKTTKGSTEYTQLESELSELEREWKDRNDADYILEKLKAY